MTRTAHLAALLACLAIPLATSAADDALPRYHFEPGQQLAIDSSSTFKYGEGKTAGEHGSDAQWTVWVVRANSDGSFRLILREKMAFSQTFQGKKGTQPAQTQIVYADVFPDGRVRMNRTIQYRGHPGTLFPKLPRDAVQAWGIWESVEGDDRTTFKRVGAATGDFVFEAERVSPMDRIYLSSSKTKYTFDTARGFVARADSKTTQGYGFKGKGTGKVELVSVKKMAPAATQAFADAADRYFTAMTAYEELTEAAERATPKEAKALLAKAVEGIKAATGLDNEELKASLKEKITQHEQMEKYYLDTAERRARVLGKPAPDFETTTLDGKKVKLSELRGRVVVLDFWYRGCGWCIKSMPQMNQLAEDFADKPVSIFGMNTDRKEEDARFVIDKMALKYTTLKAEGQPEKFGVRGFPTLIVIDPKGRVHDLHVGYSPTLRKDIGKQIQQLLATQ